MSVLKVAVIGGGASGIMAALSAKNDNVCVDLYEKNSSIGKKILASGNGRCNISNVNITADDYYGEDVSFAENVIKRFDFNKFRKFCEKIGLVLDVKEEGRVYPLSDEAKSVVEIFLASLKKSGVNIITNRCIKSVEKTQKGFLLSDENGTMPTKYDKVVITSGLLAAPQLGASFFGADIASAFKHSVNAFYPALVPLELNGSLHKIMEGVKYRAMVSLYADKKKINDFTGDVLFTKYGISGFAILDASIEASFFLLNKHNVEISVNFFPHLEKRYISGLIERASKNLKGYSVLTVLCGLLPYKISKALLKKVNVSYDMDISSLSIKSIKAITNMMFNLRFEVKNTHGFKYAEACGGGVKTREINKNTMESKLIKGLYFAGEVLDIVGKRGGYNFAFAFASGYIAGISIAEK